MDRTQFTLAVAVIASASIFGVAHDSIIGIIAYFVAPWLLLTLLARGGNMVAEGRAEIGRLAIFSSCVWASGGIVVATVFYAQASWSARLMIFATSGAHWAICLLCVYFSARLAVSTRLAFFPALAAMLFVSAMVSSLAFFDAAHSNGVGRFLAQLLAYWPGLGDVLIHGGSGA